MNNFLINFSVGAIVGCLVTIAMSAELLKSFEGKSDARMCFIESRIQAECFADCADSPNPKACISEYKRLIDEMEYGQ